METRDNEGKINRDVKEVLHNDFNIGIIPDEDMHGILKIFYGLDKQMVYHDAIVLAINTYIGENSARYGKDGVL